MSGSQSGNAESFTQYLCTTEMLDFEHPEIGAFCRAHVSDDMSPAQKTKALYYAIRDGLRYDPYSIDLSVDGLTASKTLASGSGWCVSKSIVLAACCRALGIPARLGFADVKNHLSTENLRKRMDTEIFYWHGYTSIFLNDKWVKATPAFNIELCEKFRIRPLEFDGTEDSIYHPFDLDGRQHMEYVNYRGDYADVPREEMIADFNHYYPALMASLATYDFDDEVKRETK